VFPEPIDLGISGLSSFLGKQLAAHYQHKWYVMVEQRWCWLRCRAAAA